MRTLALWCGIFTISTALHIFAGGWLRDSSPLDTYGEAARVGLSLAKNGTFSDPFPSMPTGPTALMAPAYPYLYSRVVRLFGVGHSGWWAIHLITIAAFSLQWALLPLLARGWGLPAQIGFLAAALGALLPIPGTFFKWEGLFVGLLLAGLAAITGLLAARPRRNLLWFVAAILWGITLLFSPSVVFNWLGWSLLLAYLIRHAISWRFALLIVLPLLVITPWTVRNYRIFGHFIFIRDSLGQVLALSNNDCAQGWVKADLKSGCLDLGNPYNNSDVARRLIREGEYVYNAHCLQNALAWIRLHPTRFLGLTIQRIRFFWIPPIDPDEHGFAAWNLIAISCLTILSIPGFYIIYKKQHVAGVMLFSGLLLYSAIYCFCQLDLRYRYPILWITVFAAAGLLHATSQTLRHGRS